jgi:hydrogenase nickel incorporation protein HypB
MLLTKTDLLPFVEFSADLAFENGRKMHPEIEYIALSSRKGDGFDRWLHWLNALQRKVQQPAAASNP